MRVGTIGSGFIVRTLLDKINQTDGIECGAVYSRSLEKGKALASDFGVDTVYTDLEELFSDESLDFIYVASPNSLHYEQTKRALEHGKNVICEKPMVPYAAQARELTELAKEKGLPEFCYGVLKYTGERILIRYGEDLYDSFPQYGGNMVENREYATEQNQALNLTIEQVAAMENGVIFGWDTPVANPKYYDENGHFYVPVEEPKERRRYH